jgi:hypothetical protein
MTWCSIQEMCRTSGKRQGQPAQPRAHTEGRSCKTQVLLVLVSMGTGLCAVIQLQAEFREKLPKGCLLCGVGGKGAEGVEKGEGSEASEGGIELP